MTGFAIAASINLDELIEDDKKSTGRKSEDLFKNVTEKSADKVVDVSYIPQNYSRDAPDFVSILI